MQTRPASDIQAIKTAFKNNQVTISNADGQLLVITKKQALSLASAIMIRYRGDDGTND